MAGAAEKTEKPTAKRRTEARQRGQVAKSQDINGAAVLFAALFALSAYAPKMLELIAGQMRQTLELMATPQVVTTHGIGQMFISGGKTIATVVGPITAFAVIPKLSQLAALTGMSPAALLPMLAKTALSIAQRAAGAYVVIALVDYLYQRRRHEKGLRMDKQEIKEEAKQHSA